MNSDAIAAISTHVNALSLGTATPNVARDLSNAKVVDGLVGAAGLGEGLASVVGRGNPALAALVGTYQLQDALRNIATDATQSGSVSKADVSAAAGALAGTLGGITLAITATALTTATMPVVLGAALCVAASALTIQAQKQAVLGETWETPEIKAMNDAAAKFMSDFGDAALKVIDAMLNLKFWEEFQKQGTKLFEPLFDPLNDVGNWISQNIGTTQAIKDAVRMAWDQAKNWIQLCEPLTFDLDGDGVETVGASNTNPILFDHDGDGNKNGTGWVASDDAMLVLDRNGNGTIDNGRELFGDNTIKSNGQTATGGFDALADLDSNHDGVVNNQDTQFANLKLWRDLNQDGNSQAGELFTLNELGISGINVASTATNQTLANGNQVVSSGSYTKTDGSIGNVSDINLAADTFHRQFGNVLNTSTVAKLPDMQGSVAVRDLRKAANDVEWRVVV